MTQSLAKYHARQPRYILQTEDNTLIRVAGPKQVPWEEGTEIRNISLSGLAFTAPSDLCPLVGEVIKVQFEVPGRLAKNGQTTMACYGLVTRLEPQGSHQMLVGIQFVKLELSHKLILLQGLALKLREQQAKIQQQKEKLKWHYHSHQWRQWLGFLSSGLVLILSFWISLRN
ncbi:MAG: PilZ domain-containing protein [Pseudobdellovibrionaceae bacterium]|jgi:hypothetical protein